MQQCVLLVVDGVGRGELVEMARSRNLVVQWTLEVSRSDLKVGLEELRQALHQGTIDAVTVDSAQLPGMTTLGVLRVLAVMAQLRVELVSVREPWLSTAGAQGQLIQWIVDGLRRDQSAKIVSALAKVRADGRQLGRPRAIIPIDEVMKLQSEGASLRAIARATGLGVSTIQRFLAAKREVDRHGR